MAVVSNNHKFQLVKPKKAAAESGSTSANTAGTPGTNDPKPSDSKDKDKD